MLETLGEGLTLVLVVIMAIFAVVGLGLGINWIIWG